VISGCLLQAIQLIKYLLHFCADDFFLNSWFFAERSDQASILHLFWLNFPLYPFSLPILKCWIIHSYIFEYLLDWWLISRSFTPLGLVWGLFGLSWIHTEGYLYWLRSIFSVIFAFIRVLWKIDMSCKFSIGVLLYIFSKRKIFWAFNF